MMMERGSWFKDGNTAWDSNNQAHPVNARVPDYLGQAKKAQSHSRLEAGMHD
jgi:hypothetical protein